MSIGTGRYVSPGSTAGEAGHRVPPLRWVRNDEGGAAFAFNRKGDGRWYYLDAPVEADFELSLESLAPWVTRVLDLAAPLEGAGHLIKLVEIRGGQVRVTSD